MKELYRRIDQLDPEKTHELIQVTGGKYANLQMLLTEGKTVWSSDETIDELPDEIDPEDLFRETLSPAMQLVVCGCGFVGLSVIRMAKLLGWDVIALDDREEYTKRAKEAGADRILYGSFHTSLGQIASGPSTCYVIVTREHQYDRECLNVILEKPFGYAGMMGSRHRAALMRESLLTEGADQEKVSLIHAPVGLPIHARTPEEIAVSIIAQIIEEKDRFEGGNVFAGDLGKALRALCRTQERGILATIISRKGSTPRRPGARMLVHADGTTDGTIGGGIMEANVIRKAVQSLQDPASCRPEMITIDLTGRTGENADMVCGGITRVYLELL